jgi:hypothetical protein
MPVIFAGGRMELTLGDMAIHRVDDDSNSGGHFWRVLAGGGRRWKGGLLATACSNVVIYSDGVGQVNNAMVSSVIWFTMTD